MSEQKTGYQIRFADITVILNQLIQGHDIQRLRDVHNEPNFGWDTLQQFQSLVIRPEGEDGPHYCLIDPELVRRKEGDKTNLVKALRDPTGVDFNGRMPLNPPGRFATDREIQMIVDWLNAGMPE